MFFYNHENREKMVKAFWLRAFVVIMLALLAMSVAIVILKTNEVRSIFYSIMVQDALKFIGINAIWLFFHSCRVFYLKAQIQDRDAQIEKERNARYKEENPDEVYNEITYSVPKPKEAIAPEVFARPHQPVRVIEEDVDDNADRQTTTGNDADKTRKTQEMFKTLNQLGVDSFTTAPNLQEKPHAPVAEEEPKAPKPKANPKAPKTGAKATDPKAEKKANAPEAEKDA